MKLQKILLSILVVTILSCSTESNDSSENPDSTDNTLIKKIIYNAGTDDEYSETYSYDGNKLISVDEGDGDKTIYTYENDLLIKEEHFLGGEVAAYTDIEYNSEEKVIKLTEFWLEGSGINGRIYEHKITYNNETITDVLHVKDSDTEFELWDTTTFYHENENISRIADDNGYELIFTYDDKNGIFKNIHQIEVLNLLSNSEFGAGIYSNTTNLTSFTEKDSNYPNGGGTETYIYTYNNMGYPETAIIKFEANDGGSEEDETVNYVY